MDGLTSPDVGAARAYVIARQQHYDDLFGDAWRRHCEAVYVLTQLPPELAPHPSVHGWYASPLCGDDVDWISLEAALAAFKQRGADPVDAALRPALPDDAAHAAARRRLCEAQRDYDALEPEAWRRHCEAWYVLGQLMPLIEQEGLWTGWEAEHEVGGSVDWSCLREVLRTRRRRLFPGATLRARLLG